MNIVLDTNVLVSGLLSPFYACGEIVRMVSSGELALLFDARIMSEYSEVIRRPKFQFDENKVTALVDYLAHRGTPIAPTPLLKTLPDVDDEPFLEVAVAGHAVCVVTGNLIHFPASLRQGVEVFSPSEFLTYYKNHRK